MAYATQENLLRRMTLRQLIELTDDEDTQKVDTVKVTNDLSEASGKVDGYCRLRYVTPLQPSEEVMSITLDIAVYLLFSRRPGTMNETVRQRFEDAMQLLVAISKGTAALDQPENAPEQTSSGSPVFPKRDGLRFKERDLEGYV